MDWRITCRADPSIVGMIIAGCLLQVQKDLSKILSKSILFKPSRALLDSLRNSSGANVSNRIRERPKNIGFELRMVGEVRDRISDG